MRLVNKFDPGGKTSALNKKTDGPLNRLELKRRLAFLESRFNAKAGRANGAKGLFLIMPIALAGYNNRNKTLYTEDDLYDPVINTMIRNWLFDNGEYSTVANPELSGDSVRYAKALAIFDFGRGNVSKRLTKAKDAGVDIYDSWDWLPYMPLETLDYVNFILRGLDVNTRKTKATNEEYQNKLKNNPKTVATINGTTKFK